jgi:Wnt-binding factor required for Wnt secretion.
VNPAYTGYQILLRYLTMITSLEFFFEYELERSNFIRRRTSYEKKLFVLGIFSFVSADPFYAITVLYPNILRYLYSHRNHT